MFIEIYLEIILI